MPRRRTTSPADEGIQAAQEERTAALEQEQTTSDVQEVAPIPQPLPENVSGDTPSSPMKIDVRITGTRNVYDDPTRATATVTLNDCFVVKGFRVVRGENGLFCSMPARKLRNGEYSEVCHAITPEFARSLNASVLSEYQVHLFQQMEESQQTPHVYEQEQAAPEMDAPPFEPEMGM